MGTEQSSTMSSPLPLQCDETVMSEKGHGTTSAPVMDNLRWKCDPKIADRICCYNRHYAEPSGYFLSTSFVEEVYFRTYVELPVMPC